MKTIVRATVIAASIFAAASLIPASAASSIQDDGLVYSRRLNRSIGITPAANAVGYVYNVKSASGEIVLSGRISNRNTFYLPTSRLKRGEYRFVIAGNNAQSFVIK